MDNIDLKTKKAYLSRIRHDLRTPINAILGYSELILEDCEELKLNDFSSDLTKINSCGREILEIINNILDHDKIEKIDLNLNPNKYAEEIKFKLRGPITTILGYTEILIEQSEEEHLDFLEDLQKIKISSNSLLEKLNKLIKASNLNEKSLKLDAIPIEEKRLIEDAVLTADLMNDNIIAQKIPKGRILIVDDSPVNLDLFSKQVSHFGHEVEVAEDGYTALKKIKNNSYDLILLDLIMPRMNGFQVLDKIKSNKTTKNIPIIIISALDNIDNVVNCIQLGADDFIPKPFNKILLKTRISHILEKKYLWDTNEKQMDQIKSERQKSEDLLLNILPKSIAERLKEGAKSCAERFDDVSILFADINGFTKLSEKVSAYSLVDLLNEIFVEFDKLTEIYGLEKIKTIGDCYMAASGVPKTIQNHAELICRLAVDMMNKIPELCIKLDVEIGITIGINSGPVIAGVIGENKFSYDLWGDAVNIASRLESFGDSGCINVSESTYHKVSNFFKFRKAKQIDVKGKGILKNYIIEL